MTKPTEAQEHYAEALIRHLRDENQFEAEGFARRYLRCEDRQEMSKLIDEMKQLLERVRSLD